MGRNKQPRKIGNHTFDQMKKALTDIKGGKSIRQAAIEHKISFSTLQRYTKKDTEDHLTPNYSIRKIFNKEQEEVLCAYFKKCALMFYGLTTKDCRQVAYEMAKINKVAIPLSWESNKMAGVDWLRGFRERFPDMSLRKPENCSLARATAFNKETVRAFYDNLQSVLSRSPLFADGTRIFNLDETATSTVQKNPRVLAPKGKSNICKVSSGEKGTLVTTCVIISAGGFALPPAFIFPRKNVNPRMKVGTPPGSLILASPSGWMNTETFVDVMKHFVERSGSTKECPTVLIMDNHESHLSIEAIDLAKESGVTILTLHPHTSAKLQPLDVGIFGPFKSYYGSAMESWMMRNPGYPVTIYEVGALVGEAFDKCMTPTNIKNSFKKTGIYPFDRNIFSEEDFLPSSVTDRPVPQVSTDISNKATETDTPNRDEDTPSPSVINSILLSLSYTQSVCSKDELTKESNTSIPSLSDLCLSTLRNPQSSSASMQKIDFTSAQSSHMIDNYNHIISPEQFRNPLKAGPRSNKRKPRRLGRSLIATDTPEKEAIKNSKKPKIVKKPKGKKAVRKVLQSESEEDCEIFLHDESPDEGNWFSGEEKFVITQNSLQKPLQRMPKEGEYVLVEFAAKRQSFYYVAKILEERNNLLDLYVSYLRHKKGRFFMPNTPDLAYVKDDNIKFLLPTPTASGSTARQQSYLTFDVDLSEINLR